MTLSTLPAILLMLGAAPAPELMHFDGVYENGFELSAFTPCNADGARFWVAPGALDANLCKGIDRRIERNGAAAGVLRYRVTLTGALSEPGEWGHMGMYPHTLSVARLTLIEADAIKNECVDCMAENCGRLMHIALRMSI